MAPIHWAIDGQKEEAIKLLLDFGADVNQKDDKGRDAFDWLYEERDDTGIFKRRRINRIDKMLIAARPPEVKQD